LVNSPPQADSGGTTTSLNLRKRNRVGDKPLVKTSATWSRVEMNEDVTIEDLLTNKVIVDFNVFSPGMKNRIRS